MVYKFCLPKVERDELQLLLLMRVDQLCESLFIKFEVNCKFCVILVLGS